MNVKFSVTNFWGAALILIGFITQIGHAQTVACPLYYQNNSNAQCTNPIFSPWQYVGDVTQTAYSDLASAAAGEFAALASSPAYCSIQQVGTINQCASSAASLNCLAWGYPPQPVASYDIYGTKYVVPNDGSPFACNTTITSPYAYGVKGSRSVTCPPGYILSPHYA